MNRTLQVYLILILSCLPFLVLPKTTHAAWSKDPAVNTPISTEYGNQWRPQIASDGSGGAIIVWQDEYTGYIHAQRVTAAGDILWVTDGVPISTTGGDQWPTVVGDGSGGAIISWMSTDVGVFAQRVSADGKLLWGVDGVALATAGNNLYTSPEITGDGAGGAIITWTDGRNAMMFGLYAQRLDAAGNKLWGSSGVDVAGRTQSEFFTPRITGDGDHGAIIAWRDDRNGRYNVDLYAQRIDAAGALKWTANGTAVCTADNLQLAQQIVSDGSGGAIISWQDRRNTSWGVTYAQKMNSAGVPQWTSNGGAVCTASTLQSNPLLASDGAGGAIIGWVDNRGAHPAVYAQRLDTGGALLWNSVGVLITGYTYNGDVLSLISDDTGGAIFGWVDLTNGNGFLHAQRVNANGSARWASGGTVVSTPALYSVGGIDLVSDGSGGAIVTWYDSRNNATTEEDIFAQRVFANGTLNPALSTVTTVAVSAITTVSAVGGGAITASGVSAVSARGVCWGTSPDPTLTVSCTVDGSGIGAFTSALSGLVPGTSYHVRAYATNTAGTAFGGDLTFTTTSLFMPGDVNNDQSVNVFDALLTLQFSVGLYKPTDEPTFKNIADVAPLDAGKPKGNGAVDVFDALAILRHAVGLDGW